MIPQNPRRLQFSRWDNLESFDILVAIPSISYGKLTSYYHFLFGVVLPAIELRAQSIVSFEQQLALPTAGSLDRHWEILKKTGAINVVTYRGDPRAIYPAAPLISLESFDPFCSWSYGLPLYRPCALGKPRLVSIVDFFLARHNDKSSAVPSDVVVVERDDTTRCIPNLSAAIEALSSHGLTVERVYPERMSFSAQVEMYRHTRLVISQHGAALANLAWTATLKNPPKVLEIIPPCRDNAPYFDLLCRLLLLTRVTLPQKSDTSDIDIDQLMFLVRTCVRI